MAALLCASAATAEAQTPDPPPATASRGFQISSRLSALVDGVPRQDATEFRPRWQVEISGELGHAADLRYRVDLGLEGLAAGRRGVTVDDGRADVRDAWVEIGRERFDLRAGFGRLVWGRLDEIAPTDVVNPLDAARFLLDGRTDARRAVSFVRMRWFLSEDARIEGVINPTFRRGTYDALDEPTSPFNLISGTMLPAGIVLTSPEIVHQTPDTSWENVSGGARVTATIGRVDVAAAAYRGHEPFGLISFVPATSVPLGPQIAGTLVERHLRFTMVGGDFETVRGEWALRGEIAVFTERDALGVSAPGVVPGRSVDGGVGFDRRAGDYRIFGTLLWHHDWSPADPLIGRTDVTLVGSIERPFVREQWLARAFAVVNPGDGAAFLRVLIVWRPRDRVAFDASAGVFTGTSDDTLGRFQGRDFAFGRVSYSF